MKKKQSRMHESYPKEGSKAVRLDTSARLPQRDLQAQEVTPDMEESISNYTGRQGMSATSLPYQPMGSFAG